MNRRGILKVIFAAPVAILSLKSAWAKVFTSADASNVRNSGDYWAHGILLDDLTGPDENKWMHFARFKPLWWTDGAPDVPDIPDRRACVTTVQIQGAQLKKGDHIQLVHDGERWTVVCAIRVTQHG